MQKGAVSRTFEGYNAAIVNGDYQRRTITRIVVTGPAGPCRYYRDSVGPFAFRDGTSAGDGDVAEYPQGEPWPAGSRLIFVWDNAGSGSVMVDYE